MSRPSIPARVTGIAPAQFDVLNARAAELRARGRAVLSLGQALPGFGPPASALEAARRALGSPETHVYSADAGLWSLRSALCDRLRADGVDASPDEVIVTAGGNQAFTLALTTLVDPGDEVLLAAPYFVNHAMAVRAAGATPEEVPLRDDRGFLLTWSDLEPRLSSRTRAVVVSTPSNPTGALVGAEELERIASGLAARSVFLFVDETYARFVFEGGFRSAASLPAWRDNVIVVNTFSKSFGMTGWRIGYMLADRRVCEEAIKLQDAMIICAPVISQVAVEAAIRQEWDYPSRFLAELAARREALADALRGVPGVSWTPTGGGFFAFVRVEGCVDSARLAEDLLERTDLVTIPGSTFGRCGEGFIRLSYGAVGLEELAEAGKRLRHYFSASTRACTPGR